MVSDCSLFVVAIWLAIYRRELAVAAGGGAGLLSVAMMPA